MYIFLHGKVLIWINNVSVECYPDDSGVISYNAGRLNAGVYSVGASFVGDDYYFACDAESVVLTVSKVVPILSVNVSSSNVSLGSSVSFIVSNPSGVGYSLSVNGVSSGSSYTPRVEGSYLVVVSSVETGNYLAGYNSTVFYAFKKDTKIVTFDTVNSTAPNVYITIKSSINYNLTYNNYQLKLFVLEWSLFFCTIFVIFLYVLVLIFFINFVWFKILFFYKVFYC